MLKNHYPLCALALFTVLSSLDFYKQSYAKTNDNALIFTHKIRGITT